VLIKGAHAFVDNVEQMVSVLRTEPSMEPVHYQKHLRDNLHKIKGSAALLSLTDLYDACIHVQSLIEAESQGDELVYECDRLITIAQHTRDAIQRWLLLEASNITR